MIGETRKPAAAVPLWPARLRGPSVAIQCVVIYCTRPRRGV